MYLWLMNLVWCVVFCQRITSAPVAKDQFQALTYLTQFGYIESSSNEKGSLVTDGSIRTAVMEFQRFAGINETGTLDKETMELMNTPRCGVKDKVGHGGARKKRYTLQGSKWGSRSLTYKITKYTKAKIPKPTVDEEIKRALEVWSEVSKLTFEPKTSGRVNIDISFERGEHGDGDPFDGAGGTLAHAYFPKYGGDAHFDDDERWTVGSYRGTNLFQVAAHEFGHSLGLSHSDVKGALMAPFYRGYESSFKLHSDDIRAIQALYGQKLPEGPKTGNKPPSGSGAEEGELCSDSAIDTVFMSPNKKTYAFKGDYYWEVIENGLADGYPRLISKDWSGLPSNVDAGFSYINGKTYFFKGGQYWRFTGKSMDRGYPKEIKTGFAGIPDNVDAAFVWSGNDKIYFFKGSKYWKFDPDRRPSVSYDYPKDISNWEGIPNDINAAFQWTNHYTYFFKGTYYWRFNDKAFKVDKASPAFPRSSAYWWFGCKSMSADNELPFSSSLSKDLDADIEVEENIEEISIDEEQATAGSDVGRIESFSLLLVSLIGFFSIFIF